MKALIYSSAATVELRDVPAPEPAQNEVVVRVEAAGICGSDMHAYLGHDERRPPPLILGHEASGVIVSGPREGTFVAVNPLVTCGLCSYCVAGRENLCPDRQIISMPPRQGAFAELIVIPERNLLELPAGFAFEKAAMTEPLACGWHAAKRARKLVETVPSSTTCLVIGGGAIGFGAALALSAQGFGRITIAERNEKRRLALRKSCAFDLIKSTDETEPGFQLIVDAHGDALSRAAASRLAAPSGIIVHLGLAGREGGLDARRMTLQEITFIGSYTYTAEDFRETFAAMTDNRLGPLDWFDQYPLEHADTVFAALRNGEIAAPKVILRP
ncbi:MAG: alcohol dehydrogenase catalytic domain-containing protein [Rhodomicrobiaceae bacterium]